MLTVEEALKLEVFRDCRLLTGEAGMDRRIKNINILEILDELSHVEQGEFLITTAYDLSLQTETQQAGMIEIFAERNIAALAIQTGIYLMDIPFPLLERARLLGLPVIQLPADMSFKDIIRSLLGKLLEHESSYMDYHQRVNRQLMEAYMDKGLFKLSSLLSRILNRSVCLYNAFLQPLEDSSGSSQEEVLLAHLNRDPENAKNELIVISNCRGLPDQVLVPLRLNMEIYGYLAVHGRNFTNRELLTLKQAASICLLELSKQSDAFRSRTKEIQELMQRLLHGENPEDHGSILESQGYPIDSTYQVLVVTVPEKEKNPPGSFLGIEKDEMERAAPRIMNLMQNNQIPALTSLDDSGYLVFFLHLGKGPGLERICRWLKDRLGDLFPRTPFLVGAGNPCSSLRKIRQSYDQALTALKAARMGLAGQEMSFCEYKDLGYFKLLMEIDNDHALLSFFQETIAPLLDFDGNYHGELVTTLKAYIKHLNINKAAEELFVHRHTLKYRLNKIKEITGLDVKASEDMFQVFLGLKLWEYLQKREAFNSYPGREFSPPPWS